MSARATCGKTGGGRLEAVRGESEGFQLVITVVSVVRVCGEDTLNA